MRDDTLRCITACVPCARLQTAQQWEEQGYVDPESMAELPEDEETLSKVGVTAWCA